MGWEARMIAPSLASSRLGTSILVPTAVVLDLAKLIRFGAGKFNRLV